MGCPRRLRGVWNAMGLHFSGFWAKTSPSCDGATLRDPLSLLPSPKSRVLARHATCYPPRVRLAVPFAWPLPSTQLHLLLVHCLIVSPGRFPFLFPFKVPSSSISQPNSIPSKEERESEHHSAPLIDPLALPLSSALPPRTRRTAAHQSWLSSSSSSLFHFILCFGPTPPRPSLRAFALALPRDPALATTVVCASPQHSFCGYRPL